MSGQAASVKVLLEHGVDPRARCRSAIGYPAVAACRRGCFQGIFEESIGSPIGHVIGHFECLKLLVEAGGGRSLRLSPLEGDYQAGE